MAAVLTWGSANSKFECEKPVHRVTLSSYSIGKYEVTQDLWEAVMGTNPSFFKGPRRPVECVSWNECQEFIRKLNELTGASFILPTEAEWEFAARGGNSCRGYKYSGSDLIAEVAWHDDNSGNRTHNVGTKSPNELGIYDMNGNVCEWCSDWMGAYGHASQKDPIGPLTGTYRVSRGGSWISPAKSCEISDRNDSSPELQSIRRGIRLCVSEAVNVINKSRDFQGTIDKLAEAYVAAADKEQEKKQNH